MLGLSFTNISTLGTLTIANAGGGRADELTINGTAGSNVFGVDAAGGVSLSTVVAGGSTNITLIAVSTPGVAFLDLSGLDGDDTFNIAANNLITFGVFVDGGNPSASDTVNFTGTGGGVTIDLAAQTVTQAGLAPVSLSGVEVLNVNAGAGAITVLGSTGDDNATVTPTGTDTATITAAGLNLTVNTTNSGVLTLNGLAGSDHLAVNGTQAGETITVTGALVTIAGRKTVNYAGAENLRVNGQAGSDIFDVTPSATTAYLHRRRRPDRRPAGRPHQHRRRHAQRRPGDR